MSRTNRINGAIAIVNEHLLALVEIQAHNAALLTGAGLVHFAAKRHGMQRDVVTVIDTNTNTHTHRAR